MGMKTPITMAACGVVFAFVFQKLIAACVYPFAGVELKLIASNSMGLAFDICILMTVYREEAKEWCKILFRRPGA